MSAPGVLDEVTPLGTRVYHHLEAAAAPDDDRLAAAAREAPFEERKEPFDRRERGSAASSRLLRQSRNVLVRR